MGVVDCQPCCDGENVFGTGSVGVAFVEVSWRAENWTPGLVAWPPANVVCGALPELVLGTADAVKRKRNNI